MLKKMISTTGFLTAWLFAFSLLSNCYCLPAFSSAPKAQPMMAHCQHHPDSQQNNKADCAPRYQADQFENVSVSKKTVEVSVLSDIRAPEAVFVQGELKSYLLNWADPPPISSPHFFVLHHAFLI